MEVKEKKAEQIKFNQILTDEKEIGNIWEIEIKLTNSNGVRGFGGRVINEYVHPLTQRKYRRTNPEGQPQGGYFIDKVKKILRPLDSAQDSLDLAWLLTHPEVGVEGIGLKNTMTKFKVSNPEITLRNIDRQETDFIDEEDHIDLIKGRLSLEGGPKAVSLDRLRILLAHFNLSYRDQRFIKDPNMEKKHLRNRLKRWSEVIDTNPQSKNYGKSNARKIADILDETDKYKMSYTIKEMIRFGIIQHNAGIYKYNNVPVGTSMDTCIRFFNDNPDIYNEAEITLVDSWKEEKRGE